ncbi:helix-turn-helix domain-containing protein [Bacillus sp. MCCB 382]|uniref:helix-turn-helix domain-containing protein n=1 Tax=Bacillus sp. MCCB 382 TaxID=2860197 RepID=UPI001C57D026|nr:helix-turn-helix domain-containing protein [Bacillus sp. MCCB 382]
MTNMSIGHKIRHLRKKKQMNQLDLSKGICSVSYLSKIENEMIQPSDQTLHMLLSRLAYVTDDNTLSQIQERLSQWRTLLLKREESHELYRYFQDREFTNEIIHLEYRVLLIQYHLQWNNNMTSIPSEIQELKDKVIDMPLKTKFYYYTFSANYYYSIGQFHGALQNIQEAQTFLSFLELTTLELAEFHYVFSLITANNHLSNIAVHHAEKALAYFQTMYMLKRCVDCHTLLGICQKRNFQYTLSLKHYDSALNLAKEIDYEEIIAPIKHNLSSLYNLLGQHDDSLKLLEEIYKELSDFSSFHSARITLSLIREYAMVDMKREALQCLGNVYSKVMENPSLSSLKAEYIYFHLKMREEMEELDRAMEKSIIPELLSQNKYLILSGFCDDLGEYYKHQLKYKKAAGYYELSKELLMKLLQGNRVTNEYEEHASDSERLANNHLQSKIKHLNI